MSQSESLLLVILIVLGVYILFWGGVVSWLAAEKGRDGSTWFVVGALLGPLAVAMVGFAPEVHRSPMWLICGWCKEPFRAGALRCPHCTEEIPYGE